MNTIQKVTIDSTLDEAQMEQVRNFLKLYPNKNHRGPSGECYGDYLTVHADVKGDVVKGEYWYSNVAFEIKPSGTDCAYTAQRKKERNQVVDMLFKMLAEWTQEREGDKK